MTTVRRLLLELGVVGDMTAKEQLKDVQNAANSLKKTLEDLERQLAIVGKASPQISLGGFGTGVAPILTDSERKSSEERIEVIKEQARQTHQRLCVAWWAT